MNTSINDTKELLAKVYRTAGKARPRLPENKTFVVGFSIPKETNDRINILAERVTKGNRSHLIRLMVDKMWEKIGDY